MSVPTFTTATTSASAAAFTASSGETSSRNRCVCESTSIAPITSSPETSARGIIKGHYKGTLGFRHQASGFRGWAAEAPSALYQPIVDLAATVSRFAGRFLGRPRRTLSLCYVILRTPYYVVYGHFGHRCAASDHEDDLTLHHFREVPGCSLGRPPEDFFVELRKLPAYGDRGLGGKILQRLREPVRRLEKHEGRRLGGDALQ